MKEDLLHLKVGDVVALWSSGFNGEWSKLTITGETKTRWKTGPFSEWRKKDGRKVGAGGWDFSRIEKLTPEIEEEIESQAITNRHKTIWWKFKDLGRPEHITIERLEEIYNELKESKGRLDHNPEK